MYGSFIIPSPTKLRRDIVTLPFVRHILVNTRINILQWILTKLGTYLVLKRIWNPIDLHGRMSKIKVTGWNFYRITSFWTLESTSFNGFLTKLGTYLDLKITETLLIFKVKGQGHRVKFLLRNILVNTLESTSFNGFWPNLVHT